MKQPIKMTSGDELHLTALMAPFSLNLVTGQDRQHLLGYGRSAFEAGLKTAAAAEQAAWHAGLDGGRAQAEANQLAAQHPDDAAVDALASLMKAKLAKQRDKGYGGWDDTECSQQHLSGLLRGHVDKGDPVDVANFCAFLSARGEGIAPQAAPAAVAVPDERAAFERIVKETMHDAGEDHIAERLACWPDGAYKDRSTGYAWWAWLARAALAATPAAAAQVVLPEPDFQLKWSASAGRYSFSKPITGDADCYTADTVRTLLAGASAPAAQAVEPTDAELIALNAGECYFGESPSKYPELGHGTQYHAGAPGVLGFARAALALRSDPAAYSQKFQQRVQPWMMTCFGPEISADHIERNHRFLEESLELVQSLGCTASEAHQLVDYVFGRPAGEPAQEAGGVMVTLAALCLASGLDMHACGETKLARIWTKVEAIRAKQAAKPKHSPLPMHAPQAQADARDTELLDFLKDQCIDLRCFTTSDGDDVGWRTVQHHMGEPRERVVSEVCGDEPRRAIREAMARIERDPYCTGPLHLEDEAAIAAQVAQQGGGDGAQ
ncbi:hypothetical protein [Comamonas sp. C11]|uniref:hypothetical protein n=1 Tax=Comamonas sp. C11 TaxID=2966554 RepID=UPI0021138D5A|nr:hypothetical protein [Comamonas sp. C11]UUC95560.1 hypothetical protein NOX35_09810 [Comamonas sp. C11]